MNARSPGSAVLRLVAPLVLSAVVVVALWWGFLRVYDVSPLVGKPPQQVWAYLTAGPEAAAHRAVVGGNLRRTLVDAAYGYATGLVAAIAVALAFSLRRSVERAFMPMATLLRSVPLVATTPLLILAFGRGVLATAVIGAVIVFFPALVNVVAGLRSASAQTTDAVLAFGGSRADVLLRVALPTSLPAVFASARIAVPGALIGALIAEWLATGAGLGGSILRAAGGFRYDELWASVAVLTAVSVLVYTLVGVVESLVLTVWTGRR
ncbi:ABC transporter permease subunit [Kineococcus siccus]|uniref:ABC transporter permease subunit n=1 Tax=Kineococcus siccus TaxID=2696567 RepID=UPI00196B5A8A